MDAPPEKPAPGKNNAVMWLCIIFCAVLTMKLGDYVYPDGVHEFGFRVFGAIKGAVGGSIGAGIWTLGNRLFRTSA
jgi:hypothetical protein